MRPLARALPRGARDDARRRPTIIADAIRVAAEHKNEAKRLRARGRGAARAADRDERPRATQSDFYSYRYFASEGFLPGYNFPRLPLSAFIPGRRGRGGRRDEFVQRPRFLAITEFGPRSIVYHEGARYLVNRVILPVPRPARSRRPADRAREAVRRAAATCTRSQQGGGPDLCERCGAAARRSR